MKKLTFVLFLRGGSAMGRVPNVGRAFRQCILRADENPRPSNRSRPTNGHGVGDRQLRSAVSRAFMEVLCVPSCLGREDSVELRSTWTGAGARPHMACAKTKRRLLRVAFETNCKWSN